MIRQGKKLLNTPSIAMCQTLREKLDKLIIDSSNSNEVFRPLSEADLHHNFISGFDANAISHKLLTSEISITDHESYSATDLFIMLDDDLFSFGPVSLENGLRDMLSEVDSNEFYGIIIVDEYGNKSNPLHPVIAQYLHTIWDRVKDNMYTFYVYSGNWDGSHPGDNTKAFYRERVIDTLALASFDEPISYSSKTMTYPSSSFPSEQLNEGNKERVIDRFVNGQMNYVTSTEAYISETSNDIFIIVPQQLFNTGVAYPSYGSSLIRKSGESTEGFAITPMLSANINYEPDDYNIAQGICTGGNGSSPSGLATLSHSNIDNPLNRYVLMDGYKTFIRESIAISAEFYNELIEQLPEPIEMTKELFMSDDNNSLQDWLIHLETKRGEQ